MKKVIILDAAGMSRFRICQIWRHTVKDLQSDRVCKWGQKPLPLRMLRKRGHKRHSPQVHLHVLKGHAGITIGTRVQGGLARP